jgi:hypothetical protein
VRKPKLHRRLAQADRHVALGQEHLEAQLCLIEEMKCRGCDPAEAILLLRLFEELQKEDVAFRDYLRRKLLEDPDPDRT